MSLLSWNDNLSVGVATLDADHKKLVGMINELFDAMKAGHGREALGKILDNLVDYTKIHFAREENFFAKTGYPQAVVHKQLHDDLARQVLEVQKKYQAGAPGALSLEVMNFLKNWLLTHIQGEDKRYGPYLNSKGIR